MKKIDVYIIYVCFEYNTAQCLTISFKNSCHCTKVIRLIMGTVCEWVLRNICAKEYETDDFAMPRHTNISARKTQYNRIRCALAIDLMSVFMMFLLVISIFGFILGMPISTIDWIVNWKCFANQHKHSRSRTPLTKRSKSD